ncbi:unnamed protein product [Rhizophagus irregularis]|nr:unnamed protein product [Rhizophagus irregularis]
MPVPFLSFLKRFFQVSLEALFWRFFWSSLDASFWCLVFWVYGHMDMIFDDQFIRSSSIWNFDLKRGNLVLTLRVWDVLDLALLLAYCTPTSLFGREFWLFFDTFIRHAWISTTGLWV